MQKGFNAKAQRGGAGFNLRKDAHIHEGLTPQTERTAMKDLNDSWTLATRLFAAAVLRGGSGGAGAAVHYVDVSGTNATRPLTNGATAATAIQDAVDAAVAGDEIVATNGSYATGGRAGSRVSVDKPL